MLQAVEATGYRLSKPYSLKILDDRIKKKLIFNGATGVCQLMTKDSKDIQKLLQIFSPSEVGALSRANIDAVTHMGSQPPFIPFHRLWPV